MGDVIMTPRDRIAAFALLILGLALLTVPDIRVGASAIDPGYAGTPWVLAAILLLTMDSAARPNPRLIRWGAAILFIGGFASPFLVNLINSSLGA